MVTKRVFPNALRKLAVGTAAEWRAAGIAPGDLRALARAGHLVRVRRGVYATRGAVAAGSADPRRGHALRVAAVAASVGREAVASHRSAAAIHGIDLLGRPPDAVTLTRPPSHRSGRPRPAGIVFHAAELPAHHVTRRYGVRVTTVARTVIDLARTSPFMAAVVAADSALRADLTTKAELAGVCRACGQWPGIRQARRAAEFCDGLAESVLESCARVVFAESGLEPPRLQVTIRGPGFVYRVDFLWAQYCVVAEADGASKYQRREDMLAQLRRDRLLREAGYKVVHFTWRELHETPDVVITRLRKAFVSPTPF